MSDRDIEEEVRQLRKARSYAAGYRDGLEMAAKVHESIDPACQHEPGHGMGAGAMGAVIAYRDAIRALAQQPPPTGGHGAASGGGPLFETQGGE